MLKKLAALAVVALMAAPVQAQDLDEVLNNYYEAIGGLDAWQSVQSVKATGTIMMGGMGIEAPITLMAKRPNMARLEISYQGMVLVMAYDGETAWMINPFAGATDPEEMPEDEAKEIIEQADVDGPLIGYQEAGHQLELLGMEETEGTQAYKVKLTLNTGDVQYYYFDSEYFIPIMVEASREMQGRTVEGSALISDYKEVGDLMIPHATQNRLGRGPTSQVVSSITIQQVELNVEMADSLFVMPEKSVEGQQ
jgi:outer membrane lipoprotein-sorting protein